MEKTLQNRHRKAPPPGHADQAHHRRPSLILTSALAFGGAKALAGLAAAIVGGHLAGSSPEGIPYIVFPIASGCLVIAAVTLPRPTETYLAIAALWALGAAWWSRTALGTSWTYFPVELLLVYVGPRVGVLLWDLRGDRLGRALAVAVAAPALMPLLIVLPTVIAPDLLTPVYVAVGVVALALTTTASVLTAGALQRTTT